jgi:ankyrin repeat protein
VTFQEASRAVTKGQTSGVEQAITDRALDVNVTNKYGWSLLMMTAVAGCFDLGVVLIEKGACINALNQFGESALSLAAHNGHLKFVKLLVSHGASGTVRPHGHDLETWLRNASSVRSDKIDAMLQVIREISIDSD